MSKKIITGCALMIFLLLPLISLGETKEAKDYKEIKGIVLMNWNVVEGEIISMSAEIVKIRTKDGKELSYSFTKEVRSFIREGDLVEKEFPSFIRLENVLPERNGPSSCSKGTLLTY
ncbi:MAG: hypothetical protein JW976_09130 [Syntrophaceae bacterium]|nr:hypothetical protein [Syntrophaceae bacterium]